MDRRNFQPSNTETKCENKVSNKKELEILEINQPRNIKRATTTKHKHLKITANGTTKKNEPESIEVIRS